MHLKSLLIYFLVIYFCLFNFCSAQEQNFSWQASYKYSFKVNTLQKKAYSENMLLVFNEQCAAFRSVSNAILDSIRNTTAYKRLSQGEQIALLSKYPSRVDELIQTDLKDNSVTLTTTALISPPATHPQYTERIVIDWHILQERKKILGIPCTKATCQLYGRKWTAWFSESHPFSFGPYKFFQLPGLIVQIEDDTGSYKYELTYVKKKAIRFPNNIFDNVVKLSKKDAIEIFKRGRYSLAFFSGMKPVDGDKTVQQGMEKKLKDLEKFENNPLELQLQP